MSTLHYVKTFFIVLISNLWRLYENGASSVQKSGSLYMLVCDELRFVLPGQAFKHQTKHGEVDHGLTTAGQILVILAHAAGATNPGDGALKKTASRVRATCGMLEAERTGAGPGG